MPGERFGGVGVAARIFKKDSQRTAFLEPKPRVNRTHKGLNGGVGGAENFFFAFRLALPGATGSPSQFDLLFLGPPSDRTPVSL